MNDEDWKDLREAFERHIGEFVREARDLGVDWDILGRLEEGMIETRYLLENNGEEPKRGKR